MRLVVWLVVALGCSRGAPRPEPGTPDDLAVYLGRVAGADDVTRRREVASWMIDAATWRRVVVEPYRRLYDDYARGFDAASAPLVARLATGGEIRARRHFAGDPRLTREQARLRWTVPPLYPSAVAELGGTPIDAVFIYDPSASLGSDADVTEPAGGTGWRVLAGVDALVLARATALDPVCGKNLARAGPIGHCSEVGAAIAEAAVRGETARFAKLCGLAATLCANASP